MRVAWLLCLVVLLFPSRAIPDEVPRPRAVLVLHSTTDMPSRTDFDPSLDSTLRSGAGGPLTVYTEALENHRFPGTSHAPLVRDYLRRKYAGRKIDVVIAVWDPALTFLLRYRDVLFADVPIVALVSRPESGVRTANVTVVLADFRFRETAEMALRLHPAVQARVRHRRRFAEQRKCHEGIRAQLQELEPRVWSATSPICRSTRSSPE